MAIKLVSMDLDGTLLNSDNLISAGNFQVLQKTLASGVKIALTSGRMFRSAAVFGNDLGGVPIIAYNGGYVRMSNEEQVLRHCAVPAAIALELVADARKHGWTVQVYIDDILLVDKINTDVVYYASVARVPVKGVGDVTRYLKRNLSTKILFVGAPEQLDAAWEFYKNKYGSALYITKSRPFFLEFCNPAATKGYGLEFVAEMYGLQKEETMAIGDNFNDIEHLQSAGLKIAMGNSEEPLKLIADYITEDNDHDGVAKAIEKFVFQD